MMKLNKTKIIKKYFGEVIKEEGFEYSHADAWTWNFFRKKANVKQEIILMRNRFFSNQIKLIFATGVYGWGDQEPRCFVEQYRNKEFWEYNSEEEFIAILQEFTEIVKKYGLDMLERMGTPKDPIYPTLEMNQCLFESYESSVAEVCLKYHFNKTGEEGIKEICMLLYQNKDKEYEEVKDFLIEMAVLYIKTVKDDLGGSLMFEGDKCILRNIGVNKRLRLPLAEVLCMWKIYHNEESNDNKNVMLITFQQMKIVY